MKNITKSPHRIAETLGSSLPDRLFPLPLTPFENLMVLNDRPDYPMVFECVLEFSGTIDRKPLEQALHRAWANQPLLKCRVEGRPFRGAAWHHCPGWKPQIDWLDAKAPGQFRPLPSPRLKEAPFFRAWVVRPSLETSTLVLQFHHATVDGLGAMRIIGDLLAEYVQMTEPSLCREQVSRFDPLALRKRDQPSLTAAGACLPWYTGLKESWKLLSKTPRVISGGESAEPDLPIPPSGYHSLHFSPAETKRYRNAAGRGHASLNDALLCDLFIALAKWNRAHAPNHSGSDLLRITMPVSHRNRLPQELPACNAIEFAFLTREARETLDSASLLLSIGQETELIRKHNLADHFSNGLRAASRTPGALRFLTSQRRCFSTAILSNLGDVARHLRVRLPRKQGKLQVGALTLDSVAAAPPIQANTNLAVCVIRYAGKLSLTFRTDHHTFSPELAQHFISNLKEQMRSR